MTWALQNVKFLHVGWALIQFANEQRNTIGWFLTRIRTSECYLADLMVEHLDLAVLLFSECGSRNALGL